MRSSNTKQAPFQRLSASGHLFQVFQDAAFEVVDLGKAVREQVGARLLAADAAGAEHGDLPVLCSGSSSLPDEIA